MAIASIYFPRMVSVPRPKLARIGITYFLLAMLAVLFTRDNGSVALLWFASAYLIAELSVLGRRRWGGPIACAFIASTLVTGLFGLGWQAALPMAMVNMAEAVVSTVLLRRIGHRAPFESLAWFGHFTLAVAVIAPLLSSLAAAIVNIPLGRAPAITFIQFFTGHALSNLTFAPLFMLIVRGELRDFLRCTAGRRREWVALVGASIATTSVTFAQSAFPLLFVPVLPIMLATFRLGRGAATICILALAVIGSIATLAGYGPVGLIGGHAAIRAHFFQFYLAMTVLTIWPVAADLNNRSRVHSELRESEARLRRITDHSSDVLMKVDLVGRIQFVSPSIAQLGGYDPRDLIGRSAAELIAAGDRERVAVCHQIVVAEPERTHRYEYRAITVRGEERWFETNSRAMTDSAGRVIGALSIIRDISAHKAIERTLSRAAYSDSLTGLPNRRAFSDAVERRPQNGADCLALFDIDHFKRVNDCYGHHAGDMVLRHFARVARAAARKVDMVARLGGEEFAILFVDTPLETAASICESVRYAVGTSSAQVGSEMIRVTVSGGVARIGQHGVSEALREADAALYRAKSLGRDQLALAA